MLMTLVFDGVLAIHKQYPPGKRLGNEYRYIGMNREET
jgi:hypothetical protein